MFVVVKERENPIISPNRNHHWEEFATFNLSPIKKGRMIYGLYRAISADDKTRRQERVSVVAISKSKDGKSFFDRKVFLEPKEEWDSCGCEDPRVTFFEGKYYIFYTALSGFPFDAGNIKVGLAISKDLKSINSRHLITPFNAKAMTLFPKRINGKIVVVFTINSDLPPSRIVTAYLDRIEQLWDQNFWFKWEKEQKETLVLNRDEYDHVEIGANPIETKNGWLLVYSHIQNYLAHPERPNKVYGIEAVLLDKKNLSKIVGRTRGPIITPEESYEQGGYVSDTIFPSGAIVDKNNLKIYYGAADTTVCVATVNLNDFVSSIHEKTFEDRRFKRYKYNPILIPSKKNTWESKAVFNPAVIYIKNKFYVLYRAMSDDNTSVIGLFSSKDGFKIDEKLDYPVYVPREDFEIKKIENGNSGCEDPRITKIKDTLYMCYTAYNGIEHPRIAVSTIKEKDFLMKKWNWSKPVVISPGGFDDKDAFLFPEKFKKGYFIIHRIDGEICGDYLKSLTFEKEKIDQSIFILGPRPYSWDSLKVGVSTTAIKTKLGWVVLYHGVSTDNSVYRIGAVLLDLKDPSIVLARSTDDLFEPEEDYEKFGVVNNVVFPCGIVVRGETVFIYYGGADEVLGVATMKLSVILRSLVRGQKIDKN